MILLFCFATSSVFFGVKTFFNSGIVAFETVNISGNREVARSFVDETISKIKSEKAFAFFESDNFLLFDSEKLKSTIFESAPVIKRVDVDFQIPTVLNVSIEERDAFANWCYLKNTQKSCFVVDDTGFAFKEYLESDFENDLPVIVDELSTSTLRVGNIFPLDMVKLISFFEVINKNGWQSKKVVINNNSAVYLLSDDSEIRLPLYFDEVKMASRISLLKDELKKDKVETAFKYVDLRFNNKAFIKR